MHLDFTEYTNLQIPSDTLNTPESLRFVNKTNGIGRFEENMDSPQKNGISVSVKAGLPMTIFLNNYSQINNFTPGLFKPFSEYTPPFSVGCELMNESKYILSLNYQYFDKTNSFKDRSQGDVVNRFYHVVMAEVGKSINYGKFSFSPTCNINYRLSGNEEVVLSNTSAGLWEPISQAFQYKSLGVGLGGSMRYWLFSNVYVSSDVRFVHFFEKNKPSRIFGGFEEFYNSYRVNRDVITLSLNIGYRLNMGN